MAARGAKRNDLVLTQQGANIICDVCNKELRVAKDQQKVLLQHQRDNKKCIEKALIEKAEFWRDEDRNESLQQLELSRVHQQEVQRKSGGRLCGEVLQHLFGPMLSQSLKDTIPWGPWISYFVHRHECDPNQNQVNYKQDRLWNMMRTLANQGFSRNCPPWGTPPSQGLASQQPAQLPQTLRPPPGLELPKTEQTPERPKLGDAVKIEVPPWFFMQHGAHEHELNTWATQLHENKIFRALVNTVVCE